MSKKPHQLVLLLATTACTLRPLDSADSATTTTTTTTTTTATTTTQPPDAPSTSDTPTTTPPGTTTSLTTTTTGGTDSDPTGTFITPPDGGPFGKECDIWNEDCPEGQKCMPYANDGGNSWNSLKCVDIAPNPAAPGEPCTAIGSGLSGEDTCEKHAMCWDVDPDTLTGTCIAMCIGSLDAPACADPGSACQFASDGVLILCFPQCDPIAQDCPNEDLCIPYNQGDFLCVFDASGDEGQAFDPCEYANACDPGLSCLNPELATECDPQAVGCCLPFCDTLLNPNTCPGQDQQCLPWYDQGQAPPGYENVGLCALPQP